MMPDPIFLQRCEQECAALNTLLTLLEDEQRAIVRFDAYGLDKLAASKLAALDALQSHKTRRLALLASHGLERKQAFIEWLSTAPAAAQAAWSALEYALARVQALNDINAGMAAERMQFASDTLTVLRNEAKAIDGYGRDGNFSGTLGASRRLGSA